MEKVIIVLTLKTIIEKSDTKLGKSFDIFLQVMIFITIISFSIETLPGLSDSTKSMLWLIEVVSVAIFTSANVRNPLPIPIKQAANAATKYF